MIHSSKNMKQLIDFDQLRALVLKSSQSLVSYWLPNGKRVGNEWESLNPNRGDRKIGSFKVNLITGLWSDFATDAGGSDLISLFAYISGCQYFEAAQLLEDQMGVRCVLR